MKKIFLVFMAIILSLGLASCAKAPDDGESTTDAVISEVDVTNEVSDVSEIDESLTIE